MKLFVNLLLFTLFFSTANAGNPGANYGCLTNSNSKLYTNYIYDDYAPGNPYWGPFHYYNNSPQVYDVNYNETSPGCGQVNPSATLGETGQACFVQIGNSYQQGNLKTFTLGSVTPCPIDDYVIILLLVISSLSFYLLKNR